MPARSGPTNASQAGSEAMSGRAFRTSCVPAGGYLCLFGLGLAMPIAQALITRIPRPPTRNQCGYTSYRNIPGIRDRSKPRYDVYTETSSYSKIWESEETTVSAFAFSSRIQTGILSTIVVQSSSIAVLVCQRGRPFHLA